MKKRLQWKKGLCLLLFIILALTAFPVTAFAEEDGGEMEAGNSEEEQLLAPYFVIQSEGMEEEHSNDNPIDYFPLKSTDITTNINGVIAETYVVQTYANEGDKPINARYVFPTSSSVTVHGMKMEIGNHVVTAKIKEKEEAKAEYEEAKSEGKSASLLEQKRPNVFTMDVANIMPGDTARIELHYTEMIASTEGVYEFVFPTVVGPRYSPDEAVSTAAPDDTEIATEIAMVSEDRDALPEDAADFSDSKASEEDAGSEAPANGSGSEAATDDTDSAAPADDADSEASANGSDSEAPDDADEKDNADSQDAADGSADPKSSPEQESASPDDWVASPYLPEGTDPLGEYHITVNLSTGVPIADVSCKSHEINVAKAGDSQATITLANQEDFAGNRDFILKYKLTNETVQSGLMLTSSESENYFMLTVQPPERFTPEDIPPREYIFVLDISGSMYGYPLDTAKSLIRNLVSNLKETDKFNLVLFEDDTYLLAGKSVSANEKNISTAMDLIDEQEGGGGTSLLPALDKAISIPMNPDFARSIVVITDGYISNESEIYDVINENMSTTSFFSFGIGGSVNDYLIKGIAQCGFGEAFIVTDSEDAAESAERFRTYIESPLLTGITVDYEGFDVYDVATATPSILYAEKPLVLFGKWKGDPSGTITVSGKTGSEDYVQEIPVDDVTVDTENEAIRYLWARTKLDQLAGYGSTRNDDSVKEEITKIGLDYNMTTPYTSFVAVVEEVRNETGDSKDVNQASPLPLQVSNLAVGGGYTAYSEPGGIVLGVILTAVSLSSILYQNKRKRKQGRPQKNNP